MKKQKNIPKKIIGTISINSKGVGFVAPEILGQKDSRGKKERDRSKMQDDIMIEENYLNTALNGDTVEISLLHKSGRRQTAEVIKIVNRIKTKFVGSLERENDIYFLVPDDKKMYTDIVVPDKEIGKAKVGEKIQVEIVSWSDPKRNPIGKIIEIIGKKGDNNTEMKSIVLEKGFEIGFPVQVEAEAKQLEKTEKPIQDSEIASRKDFRNTLTFTIDPEDAKDFDDALSYKEIGE